ncbi:MAG: thiol:disulfide interchange protein DsbD [Polaribacter sp.]|jgi:thiol:disulfide interchange protein DsbD
MTNNMIVLKTLKTKPVAWILSLILFAVSFITVPSIVSAIQDDDLLRPEQAFQLTAKVEGNSLIAEYDIAPGYYLYRQRFKFDIENEGVRFAEPIIPKGKVTQDEFFGEVETYRDSLRIELPIDYSQFVSDTPLTTLRVKATGQGCADIGICYPPLDQLLLVSTSPNQDDNETVKAIPYVATSVIAQLNKINADENSSAFQSLLLSNTNQTTQQTATLSSLLPSNKNTLSELQSLGDLIGLSNEEEIPHSDSAFILSAELVGNDRVDTNINIIPTAYLYRDKVDIKLVGGNGHSIGPLTKPAGIEKNDEFFGLTEVYHDSLRFSIPISSSSDASPSYTLAYSYQGCIEDRICYPPITKYLKVDSNNNTVTISDQLPQTLKPEVNTSPAVSASQSEQGQYAQLLLQNKSLFLVIWLFFLAGLGLTFTPCVFPMIPILSSIIAGQGDKVSPRSAFTLSLVYVLAMAVTYALAGAIVGYYGAEYNIQIWFQDPIILSIFATIFVLLSLSMFGFYDLQLPSAIQTRLTSFSNKQEGGSLVGAGLMGFFSAIIVGPCITAPLVGALLFISQTQDWQLGGLALFALGMGMGTPLLLIGTSAGKILPRAGGWMDTVKSVFGVVMLAMAIWLLERILPTSATMALIAILIITSSIYMGALEKLPQPASGWRKLCKGLGVILLAYGVAYLIGATAGSQDLIQPLKGLGNGITSNNSSGLANDNQSGHINFKQIRGTEGLKRALTESVAGDQFTMLDFYADWCISCKEMEKYVFTHPAVLASLDQVSTLQADVTANDSIDSALMNSLGIYGPPAILFFDKSGIEIRSRRIVGEMSGQDFAAHVRSTFQ